MHAKPSKTFWNFSGKRERDFLMIYTGLILLSVHWSLVIYINSSFLEQFFSSSIVSIMYTLGSLFSLLLFFYIPIFLQRIGNYKLILLFSVLEICALLGMASTTSAILAVLFFVMHFVLIPLILFNIDIFIEDIIGSQEKQTGSRRGLYLSLASFAAAVAPPISGSLIEIGQGAFSYVYIVSALFLIPFVAIIGFYFRKFKDPAYVTLSVPTMAHILKTQADTRNIVIIGVHLQLFFTWMIIYTPLYLAHVAGFSWIEIGIIMFVGLSAYVIFEYPIGIIADRYIGEKEMMAFGFVLIAVSTSWFAFIPNAGIGVWMVAMFLTRVGASFVEATSESYFFKHMGSVDTHKISLFRMTRPLSSVIGAALGSVILLNFEFNFLFIILAIIMIPAIFITMQLKDTISLREE